MERGRVSTMCPAAPAAPPPPPRQEHLPEGDGCREVTLGFMSGRKGDLTS